ncbi:required for meiotic nuclear division protein 1 homolog isoform X2 [Corticium candelabrum]|nr:required for meiotic nuclear division protein 1 homolog isoform X2 [Corticium candelabrum]
MFHRPLLLWNISARLRLASRVTRSAAPLSARDARPVGFRCIRVKSTSLLPPPKVRSLRATKKRANEKMQESMCIAFATAEMCSLQKVQEALQQDHSFIVTHLPEDVWNAVHATVKSDETQPSGDIFIFRFGTVVCWNVSQSQQQKVLKLVTACLSGAYSPKAVEQESETMVFAYKSGHSRLHHDTILLDSNVHEDKRLLEKYAFSDAMSLSVKLGMWEAALDKYVESIIWVPQTLKLGQTLKISRKQVLQKTGELIALRHEMNLMPDVSGTPDFYWDHHELELLYQQMCRHLDVSPRRKIVNEKLDYCSELTELLRTHMGEQHSNRLEWLIIILIAVEV